MKMVKRKVTHTTPEKEKDEPRASTDPIETDVESYKSAGSADDPVTTQTVFVEGKHLSGPEWLKHAPDLLFEKQVQYTTTQATAKAKNLPVSEIETKAVQPEVHSNAARLDTLSPEPTLKSMLGGDSQPSNVVLYPDPPRSFSPPMAVPKMSGGDGLIGGVIEQEVSDRAKIFLRNLAPPNRSTEPMIGYGTASVHNLAAIYKVEVHELNATLPGLCWLWVFKREYHKSIVRHYPHPWLNKRTLILLVEKMQRYINRETTGTAMSIGVHAHACGPVTPAYLLSFLNEGYAGGLITDLLTVRVEYDISVDFFEAIGTPLRIKVLRFLSFTLISVVLLRPSKRLQEQSVLTWALMPAYDLVMWLLPARLLRMEPARILQNKVLFFARLADISSSVLKFMLIAALVTFSGDLLRFVRPYVRRFVFDMTLGGGMTNLNHFYFSSETKPLGMP